MTRLAEPMRSQPMGVSRPVGTKEARPYAPGVETPGLFSGVPLGLKTREEQDECQMYVET